MCSFALPSVEVRLRWRNLITNEAERQGLEGFMQVIISLYIASPAECFIVRRTEHHATIASALFPVR